MDLLVVLLVDRVCQSFEVHSFECLEHLGQAHLLEGSSEEVEQEVLTSTYLRHLARISLHLQGS